MESIYDYKELNKPIIAKIMETLEKFPDPEVQANGIEILIRYDDKGVIKHDVARYWKNNSGHWLGTVGSLFDFDFYAVRKVVGFAILEDIVDLVMEWTEGKIFQTIED